MVDKADKVVIIAGPKLKPLNALEPFVALTRDLDCCVAVMPDAKGVFNEFDDNYLGYYWGSISSPSVLKALDDSDLIVYCGPRFNDYTTMGWTSTVNYDKSIVISVDHVHVRNVRYSYICLPTVLHRLAGNVSRKYNFVRTKSDEGGICTAKHQMEDPVSLSFLLEELQLTVGSGKYCSVVAETGDCWFIAEKLKVPPETMFCIQMQYGSIGWAVGASLGVGLMARQMGCGKLLSLIGDGSFQVSAQELSTIISEQLDVTILLINNASYTIEDQIHPGSYNQLINWKYTQLLDAFRGDRPAARSYFCKSNKDLKFALCDSYEHYGVALIECYMDKNECTEEMRKWGQHIAAANART